MASIFDAPPKRSSVFDAPPRRSVFDAPPSRANAFKDASAKAEGKARSGSTPMNITADIASGGNRIMQAGVEIADAPLGMFERFGQSVGGALGAVNAPPGAQVNPWNPSEDRMEGRETLDSARQYLGANAKAIDSARTDELRATRKSIASQEGVWNTIKAGLANPSALASYAIESLPQMGLGTGLARVGGGLATVIGTEAAVAGGSTAAQVRETVRTPEARAVIVESPEFQALAEKVGEDAAFRQIEDDAALVAGALTVGSTAAVGALAARFGGEYVNRLLAGQAGTLAGKTVAARAGQAAQKVGLESASEFGQGSTEQISQNIGEQTAGLPTQTFNRALESGTLEAMAGGPIAGIAVAPQILRSPTLQERTEAETLASEQVAAETANRPPPETPEAAGDNLADDALATAEAASDILGTAARPEDAPVVQPEVQPEVDEFFPEPEVTEADLDPLLSEESDEAPPLPLYDPLVVGQRLRADLTDRVVSRIESNGVLAFPTPDEAARILSEERGAPLTAADIAEVQGFHTRDGRNFVILEHVDPENAAGVVLHEVGVHYGEEIEAAIADHIREMPSLRGRDAMVDDAYASVPEGTPANRVDAEALAYLNERNPQHGLVRRMLDSIRNFFARFGVPPALLGEDRVDVFRRTARNALKRAGQMSAREVAQRRESATIAPRDTSFSLSPRQQATAQRRAARTAALAGEIQAAQSALAAANAQAQVSPTKTNRTKVAAAQAEVVAAQAKAKTYADSITVAGRKKAATAASRLKRKKATQRVKGAARRTIKRILSAEQNSADRDVAIKELQAQIDNWVKEPGLETQQAEIQAELRRAKALSLSGDQSAIEDYSDLRQRAQEVGLALNNARDAATKAKAAAAQLADVKARILPSEVRQKTVDKAVADVIAARKAVKAALASVEAQSQAIKDAAKAARNAAAKAKKLVTLARRKTKNRAKSIVKARAAAAGKRQEAASDLGVTPAAPFVFEDRFKQKGGTLRKGREKYQDRLISQRYAQEQAGTVTDEENVYRRENLMSGRVGARIEQQDRELVQPVEREMKQRKISDELMTDFLEASHAEERNLDIARKNASMPDGGSGMKTQEARDFLAGNAPGKRSGETLTPERTAQLERIGRRIWAANEASADLLLDAGLITAETRKAMRKWKRYVPLKDAPDADEIGFGTGRGVDSRGKPIQRALGRGSRADTILAHTFEQLAQNIIRAERARLGQTLARLVLAHPSDLWTMEKVETEQKMDSAGEVYTGLKNLQNDPNTIVVKLNGVDHRITIENNRLAEALKSANLDQLPEIISGLAKLSRVSSALLTRYSPSFIFTNLARDLGFGMAAINAIHGFGMARKTLVNWPSALRALWAQARGKGPVDPAMAAHEKAFRLSGSKTYHNQTRDVAELQAELEARFLTPAQLAARGRKWKALGKFVAEASLVKQFLQSVENVNDTLENGMRLAYFSTLRDELDWSVERSAEAAKNLTVNFSRRGSQGATLNAIWLFFNAAMQSAQRFGVLVKSKAFRNTLVAMAGVQALSTLALMADIDDDGISTWDKISRQEKERNLIVPTFGLTEAGYLKLPLQYGLNVPGYVGGRIVEETMKGLRGDKVKPLRAIMDTVGAFAGSFIPVKIADGFTALLPYHLQIPVQVASNKDGLGRPIHAEEIDKRQPMAHQGRADTGSFYHLWAQAMSALGGGDEFHKPDTEALNFAPEDLRHYTRSILGGPFAFVSDLAEVSAGMSAGTKTMEELPIIKSFVPSNNDRPGIGRLYAEVKQLAYEEEKRMRAAFDEGEDFDISEYKHLEGSMKISRNKDGMRSSRGLVVRKGGFLYQLKEADKEIAELRDEKNDLLKGDLPWDERRQKITKLDEEIESIQRAVIKERNSYRKD